MAKKPIHTLRRVRRMPATLGRLHDRERRRIRKEIASVPGLMALLMKPRNGELWNDAERVELRARLHQISPVWRYLAAIALPGVTLTLLAWWLDRRAAPRVIVSRTAYLRAVRQSQPAD